MNLITSYRIFLQSCGKHKKGDKILVRQILNSQYLPMNMLYKSQIINVEKLPIVFTDRLYQKYTIGITIFSQNQDTITKFYKWLLRNKYGFKFDISTVYDYFVVAPLRLYRIKQKAKELGLTICKSTKPAYTMIGKEIEY